MDREELIAKLSQMRPELDLEGVDHLALFGSRSRGDHRADSDVDLLVDVAPDSRFSILNLVGVEQIVARETGLRANALMRRSLKPKFRDAILEDVVDIF